MTDTLATAFELNKLNRTLCSEWHNWGVFQVLWDGILEGKVDSEVRGQVITVQTQMQSFNFFFGIQPGVLVLRYTDNLFSTLQHTHAML